MEHDRRWLYMWKKYMDFLFCNKRRPSKYIPEDKPLVNWLKYNRKLLNKGELPDYRKAKLDELLAEAKKFQRVNQHSYLNSETVQQ
jgi:hypothetical protein